MPRRRQTGAHYSSELRCAEHGDDLRGRPFYIVGQIRAPGIGVPVCRDALNAVPAAYRRQKWEPLDDLWGVSWGRMLSGPVSEGRAPTDNYDTMGDRTELPASWPHMFVRGRFRGTAGETMVLYRFVLEIAIRVYLSNAHKAHAAYVARLRGA